MTATPALTISPLSALCTASAFCRLGGALWATVVVKATFQLVHGENARIVAPLDLVREDQANADHGSLVAARETAPHLPGAGVMLTGHACAPEGRAVPSMSVRLGVSRDRPLIDKTLHVFGARAPGAPSVVTPFQRMPLVYERAFGGAGVWQNPVGIGGPGSAALPNVVDPKDPRKVAGFGPLARQWMPRRGLLGGVDPAAMSAPIWDVPAGFDWRFFQAAPEDQQIERLRGDEWILLDGMNAGLPRVQSRLPHVMAVARKRVVGPPGGSGAAGNVADQPIELRADMLVIDADRLLASLVWRGRFVVESPEAAGRIQVLVGLEQPGKAVEWPAPVAPGASSSAAPVTGSARTAGGPSEVWSSGTQDVDLGALFGGVVPFAADREGGASVPSKPVGGAPVSTGTGVVDLKKLFQSAVPFPGAKVPVQAVGELPPSDGPALPFGPADPRRPPPESLPTPAGNKPAPIFTGTTDIDLATLMKGAVPYRDIGGAASKSSVSVPVSPVPETSPLPAPVSFAPVAESLPASFAPVAGSLLASLAPVAHTLPAPVVPIADAPPPALPQPSAPELQRSETAPRPPAELAPSAAALARKRAESLLAGERAFDREDFAGANLSGLDLSGRSMERCNLRGAKLRGANLTGANLASAVLDEADLRGALLSGADLREASLDSADLERANLSEAVGVGASLRQANLLGACLEKVRFSKACFAGAMLRDARGAGGDFAGARFEDADLRGSSFRGASFKAAVLAGSNLEGADFQKADLGGANLHRAVRRMTKLAGANLTGVDESAPVDGELANEGARATAERRR